MHTNDFSMEIGTFIASGDAVAANFSSKFLYYVIKSKIRLFEKLKGRCEGVMNAIIQLTL